MLEETISCACPCGELMSVRALRSWTVDDPALLGRLLAGDFNKGTCARCGTTSTIAMDLLSIHHGSRWAVQVVADDAKLAETSKALRELLPGSRNRIVANRLEAMEKARAFAAGLDDVALAIAKFQRWVTLSEADRACKLWFDRIDGDQLLFTAVAATGVKGSVRVPREVFDRIARVHATAQYQDRLIVDEGFARKLIEHERAASAAALPTPLQAIAASLRVGGVTAIKSVSSLDPRDGRHARATVHVLQRILADDRPEGWFYIVTNGLSAQPLVSTSADSLHRFEFLTLSRRHDEALLDSLSSLGENIHRMCASPASPPIGLGHRLSIGSPGLRGWPALLFSSFVPRLDTSFGPVDFARVTPITVDEHAELRDAEPTLRGAGFVLLLENQDFFATLDRWYAHR